MTVINFEYKIFEMPNLPEKASQMKRADRKRSAFFHIEGEVSFYVKDCGVCTTIKNQWHLLRWFDGSKTAVKRFADIVLRVIRAAEP